MKANTQFEPILFERSSYSAGDLFDFLLLRKGIILCVTVAVFVTAAFLTLYLISPNYEAATSLIIDSSQVHPTVENAPASDFEKIVRFQNQVDIIKSSVIVGQAVDQLDLTHKHVLGRIEIILNWVRGIKRQAGFLLGMKSWQKAPNPRADAVEAIISHLVIDTKPQSSVLKIIYRAKDPDEAAETLKSMILAYQAYFNDQIQQQASGIVTYLEEQLRDEADKLRRIEQDLLDFEQSDRIDLETPTHQPGAVADVPRGSLLGVTNSPKVQDELKSYVLVMEEDLRKMQAQYAPTYAPMVELKAKIARYVDALNAIPGRELRSLRLRRSLEFQQDASKFVHQNLERARIVQLANTAAIGMINVLEVAEPDDNAISPKSKIILPAALAFGLILGVVLAAIVQYFDHRIYTEADLVQKVGVRVIASLPGLSRKRKVAGGATLRVRHAPESAGKPVDSDLMHLIGNPAAIAVASSVQAELALLGNGRSHGLVLISATGTEDTAGLATLLALSLASGVDSRVLLVDAMTGTADVGPLLGMPPDTCGFTDCMLGRTDLENCLVETTPIPLGVVARGRDGSMGVGLTGERLSTFTQAACAEYSPVLVVCDPPNDNKASLLVARAIGQVLIVVDRGGPTWMQLRSTIENCERAGAVILGVVLNHKPLPLPSRRARAAQT